MINIYFENESHKNNITYAFETIFRCIHENALSFQCAKEMGHTGRGIYYGKHIPENFIGVVIQEGYLFSDKYLTKEAVPVLPLKSFQEIPALFLNEDQEIPTVTKTDRKTIINFDIIQGTFYLVTGCEEIIYRDMEHDVHSRFRIKDRLLYKEGLLYKPVVNLYAAFLRELLVELGFDLSPQKHEAYVHISHDVDEPYKQGNRYINKVLGKLGFSLKKKIHTGFDYIKGTEAALGLKSSWYFMAGGNNRGYEGSYDFADKDIQALRKKLLDYGDEIGWHYSYNAPYDEIQMRREFFYYQDCTGEKPVVGRNHYLRYLIPESWRTYCQLGLCYDATLGSAEHEGFVYGICTPFQLYDAVQGERLDVWEIPLIVMDGTVCTEQYRNQTPDQVICNIHELVQTVKQYDGVFSVLWHNSSVCNKYWKKWEKTYQDIMEYVSKELICASGKEIIAAYRD